MTNEELSEKCLQIICNEDINRQREIVEILKIQIEENFDNMNDAAMEDYSFGI
jgi:arginine repressor